MSCLACKIYERSAWRAMTDSFIQHQLVALQQVLGTESLFLIFARAPAPEIFAPPRPAGKLTSLLPKLRWRERLFCDRDLRSAHWATPLHDLRPLRQLYRHTLLCESKCHSPPAQSSVLEHTLRRPADARMSTCARRLGRMSGSLQ